MRIGPGCSNVIVKYLPVAQMPEPAANKTLIRARLTGKLRKRKRPDIHNNRRTDADYYSIENEIDHGKALHNIG